MAFGDATATHFYPMSVVHQIRELIKIMREPAPSIRLPWDYVVDNNALAYARVKEIRDGLKWISKTLGQSIFSFALQEFWNRHKASDRRYEPETDVPIELQSEEAWGIVSAIDFGSNKLFIYDGDGNSLAIDLPDSPNSEKSVPQINISWKRVIEAIALHYFLYDFNGKNILAQALNRKLKKNVIVEIQASYSQIRIIKERGAERFDFEDGSTEVLVADKDMYVPVMKEEGAALLIQRVYYQSSNNQPASCNIYGAFVSPKTGKGFILDFMKHEHIVITTEVDRYGAKVHLDRNLYLIIKQSSSPIVYEWGLMFAGNRASEGAAPHGLEEARLLPVSVEHVLSELNKNPHQWWGRLSGWVKTLVS
ncbi:MAG: hypothetical protein QW815_03520 [Nitrososphaerota archaeon]